MNTDDYETALEIYLAQNLTDWVVFLRTIISDTTRKEEFMAAVLSNYESNSWLGQLLYAVLIKQDYFFPLDLELSQSIYENLLNNPVIPQNYLYLVKYELACLLINASLNNNQVNEQMRTQYTRGHNYMVEISEVSILAKCSLLAQLMNNDDLDAAAALSNTIIPQQYVNDQLIFHRTLDCQHQYVLDTEIMDQAFTDPILPYHRYSRKIALKMVTGLYFALNIEDLTIYDKVVLSFASSNFMNKIVEISTQIDSQPHYSVPYTVHDITDIQRVSKQIHNYKLVGEVVLAVPFVCLGLYLIKKLF